MIGQLKKQIFFLLTGFGLVTLITIPLIAGESDSVNGSVFNPDEPQCGHWAILRSCELLGVPIEMQTILKLLPPREEGTNMLELRNVFRQIGLKATGKRETLADLIKGSYPAIAHFTGNHFVTVSIADDKVVRFFDGSGRAKTMKLSDFGNKWGHTLLVIQRENRAVPLPSFVNRNRRNQSCIEFDKLIIDKGDVRWNGKPIEYEFSVYNMGEAPLVIKDIKTNCGCLGADGPDTPILPGSKGTIVLKYSVNEGQGSFKHEALVKSNDPGLPLVKLTAAGNTDTKVQINPKFVSLGRIVPGQTKTATVSVHFTGDFPLEICEALCKKNQVKVVHNLLSQELAREFRHGINSTRPSLIMPNSYVLQITYEAGTEDLGKTEIDTVVIHTNIDGFEEISIPVFAKVVNPVRLYPSTLVFTGVKPDKITSKTVEVVSLDGSPFQVISVKAKNAEINYNTTPGFAKRKSLSLSAKGITLLNLSDTILEIEVEVRGQLPKKQNLQLPIYVYSD